MTPADFDTLIRQVSGGDAAAAAGIVDRARTSEEPVLLVAAALIGPPADLLARATALAVSTRDRQLLDHPDSVLVAWIAAGAPIPGRTVHRPASPPDDDKEQS